VLSGPTRRRRALALATALAALATGACGGPSQLDRPGRIPTTPPSPIAGECWPLPADVRFDFSHQVTHQYTNGERWVLVIQWNRLGDEEVAEHLRSALVSGGFEPLAPEAGWQRFDRPGYGAVAFEVTPLEGVDPDTVVRGSFQLDLPRSASSLRGDECPKIRKVKPDPAPTSVVEGVGS
jgi:hypothetical protein